MVSSGSLLGLRSWSRRDVASALFVGPLDASSVRERGLWLPGGRMLPAVVPLGSGGCPTFAVIFCVTAPWLYDLVYFAGVAALCCVL